MPNTLAHLGLQGFASRVAKAIDPKWVALGCLIPDLPWILQRLLAAGAPGIDRLDLRLYVVVQATLFFSLLLSAALASLAKNFLKTFAILGTNAFAHLLLDATQTKWANGVHLLAPFSWKLSNWGWYWPEHVLTYLMTASGIVYLLVSWRPARALPLRRAGRSRWLSGAMLLLIYLALPIAFMPAAEASNSHFVKTLRDADHRVGEMIEFDRAEYRASENGGLLLPFTGEKFYARGIDGIAHAALSIKGRFFARDSIQVEAYHIHNTFIRDLASYVALIYIATIWALGVWPKSLDLEVSRIRNQIPGRQKK